MAVTKNINLRNEGQQAPYFNEALKVVQKEGYHLLLRNAGGLGVISDTGILNVSLILPKNSISALSIDDGYQAMVDWLEQTRFGKLGIEIGEVADSYCPGKYDLSIKGKKLRGSPRDELKKALQS